MPELEAERADTAFPLTSKTRDGAGGALLAGQVLAQSVLDLTTGEWLNMTTGAWQAGVDTAVKTEVTAGVHVRNVNLSNTDAGTPNLLALSEVTAGTLLGLWDIEVVRLVRNYKTLPTEGQVRASILSDDTPFAGANIDAAISTRAVAGGAMSLTAAALQAIEDEVLDAPNAAHLVVGSIGFNQDAAAAGGAGLTSPQVAAAVWDADTIAHVIAGSMGRAMADGAEIPASLSAILARYLTAVRKYGPVAIKQPLAVKDEVHAGDIGTILTVPVVLDGNYSDLADATSITFNIQAPGTDTVTQNPGLGVTTPTGSYTTWPSDSTVFTSTGRWLVDVLVTWPDATTKQSLRYPVDVQPPLPLI